MQEGQVGLRRQLGASNSGSYKLSAIINETTYNLFFLHKDDPACPARLFFNYTAFVNAAKTFPKFGTTGSLVTRRQEVAAFFGQTSHETTGGWPTAPDGPYAWGYCFKEEISQDDSYCDATATQWPCVPGQKYFGRGPIQLSWNFNYGPAGQFLAFDGLGNPDLVATDPYISFQTALWFWMTPQSPKPSAHDVITGKYRPTAADRAAKRFDGYGLITNIINGGLECGPSNNPSGVTNAFQVDRIGFYERYCQILGTTTGSNVNCTYQSPYGA
eukprot:TRINITY_DN14758_c0_g1_i1.p1 TRINITY_DN14758_c0_g1~~TRINITY_DN14758_c0_g1_i1.p1  ORF type:complete len:272 (+),score=17.30 TRINITY_DN14758_c0_g1_i1:53-868(+)